MERVTEAADFFAAPHGRYLVAEGMTYWCYGASLWGVTLWGTLTSGCIAQLTAWIDQEHERSYPAYVTLLDFSRLRGVDADAFTRWQGWYEQTRHRQRQRVTRAAIVRPDGGLAAAMVAGMPFVLGPLVPCAVSLDLRAGLEALEVPEPAEVARALDAMYEDAVRAPRVLDTLRSELDRNLRSSSLDGVASSLGVSVRTLQRQLQSAGTSFDVEVQRARVRFAQRLLAEGDTKLGAVALEAGFATQAHFNTVFRRVTGETPGAWRQRIRGSR